jgi:hypothetical protein
MQVGGQLHAPAALRPGKETPVSIGQKAGLDPEQVWTRWRKEEKSSSLPMSEIEPGSSIPQLSLYVNIFV